MNIESQTTRRNITWQVVPPPSAPCDHEYEVIPHEGGFAVKRCVKCGSTEAE